LGPSKVEFWKFQFGNLIHIAMIISPPSSFEIFMERAQKRKHWDNYKDSTLSHILRSDSYRSLLLQRLINPTRTQVSETHRRLIKTAIPTIDDMPKIVLLKNGNHVYASSTMNQSVRELDQRWNARLRAFDAEAAGSKFDRSFHILRMPGKYTLDIHETFPQGTSSATLKAAFKRVLGELRESDSWVVVNDIVGNSRMNESIKYIFYRIFRADNPSECYIGRTTKSIEFRISDHRTKKFKEVYSSFELFRDDDFSWEILSEQTVSNTAEADRIESEYIRSYPTAINIKDPLTNRKRARESTSTGPRI